MGLVGRGVADGREHGGLPLAVERGEGLGGRVPAQAGVLAEGDARVLGERQRGRSSR